MSVSKICDQDLVCIFEKDHARVINPAQSNRTVAKFMRDGGLYTCTMKLRAPKRTEEAGNGSVFHRPE